MTYDCGRHQGWCYDICVMLARLGHVEAECHGKDNAFPSHQQLLPSNLQNFQAYFCPLRDCDWGFGFAYASYL